LNNDSGKIFTFAWLITSKGWTLTKTAKENPTVFESIIFLAKYIFHLKQCIGARAGKAIGRLQPLSGVDKCFLIWWNPQQPNTYQQFEHEGNMTLHLPGIFGEHWENCVWLQFLLAFPGTPDNDFENPQRLIDEPMPQEEVPHNIPSIEPSVQDDPFDGDIRTNTDTVSRLTRSRSSFPGSTRFSRQTSINSNNSSTSSSFSRSRSDRPRHRFPSDDDDDKTTNNQPSSSSTDVPNTSNQTRLLEHVPLLPIDEHDIPVPATPNSSSHDSQATVDYDDQEEEAFWELVSDSIIPPCLEQDNDQDNIIPFILSGDVSKFEQYSHFPTSLSDDNTFQVEFSRSLFPF
jgi:hypothetical protein